MDEHPPPLAGQLVLTAEAEVIRGGLPVPDPQPEPGPDDDEEAQP